MRCPSACTQAPVIEQALQYRFVSPSPTRIGQKCGTVVVIALERVLITVLQGVSLASAAMVLLTVWFGRVRPSANKDDM